MADVILIDNEYVTMKYLEDKKTIYHVVHKPIAGQPLRDMLLTGIEALEKYGVHKWLSDDRKNGPMPDDDRAWAEVNIDGHAGRVGWKYWALVVPQQIIAAGSMAPVIEFNFQRGMRMMVFSDPDEAQEWLDQFED